MKGCHLCKEVQFFQSDGLLQSYKNGRLRYFSQLSEREGTESNGPVRFIPKHLRANPKVKVTKIPELKENTRGKAESKKLKSEPRNVGAVEDEPTETTNDILIERRVEGNNANFAADLDTEEQFSDSEEASTVIRNEERRQNRDLKKTAFTRVSNSESEREYLQNVTDRIEAGKQTSSSISISNSMKKKPVFTYGDGTVMDFSSKLPGGMTLGELLKVSNNEEEDHEEKENNLEEQELVVEAKTIAYNLLAKRSMTVSVLKEKLEKKMIQEHIIKVVVQELKKSGFLNDMAYAIDYARVRFQGSSWGPSRIRHELKKRGVSSNDIKLAISEVFKEENTNEDNTKGDEIENFDAPKELSVTAWEQLKIAASRQWSRGSQTNKEGKKRRMVGWLQRRGYSWSLVSRILAELEGENKD